MKKQGLMVLAAFSCLVVIATLIGCGTLATDGFLIPVGGAQFAFVVDSVPDSTVTGLKISAYSLDSSSGKLTPVPGSPFSAAAVSGRGNLFMDADPTGHFLFVPNRDADTVSVFSIGSNGALTVLGSPVSTNGSDAFAVKVDPSGKYLYVANQGSGDITAFRISSTGTLTQIGNPVSADGDVHHLFMDPKGRFLYAGIWGEGYAVNGFAISSTDGSLTYIGAAFAPVGKHPQSGTVDSTGKFLLVTNNGSDTVSVFQIDQTTGGLTAVAGSPFATGNYPFHVAQFVVGGTTYMAVSNTDDGTISVYSFNTSTGNLTPNGSPASLGLNFPIYLALDESGRFGYITDEGNDNIVGVTVSATGEATAIPGSPFAGGGISHPAQMVIVSQQ